MRVDEKKPSRLVSVEECPNCGILMKRPFKEGDYVTKPGGECRRCGHRMAVKLVYKEVVAGPAGPTL